MVLLNSIKSYFSDFYFFRVNDNTMRSYYRQVLYLYDNYRAYGNHGECRQSRPVFSRPRVNIGPMLDEWRQSSFSTASTYLIHIFTYFRDFWCERKFCTRFYCYSNQKQKLFQWFLEENIEKSMRSYYRHLPPLILPRGQRIVFLDSGDRISILSVVRIPHKAVGPVAVPTDW